MDDPIMWYAPENVISSHLYAQKLINYYFGEKDHDNNIGDC